MANILIIGGTGTISLPTTLKLAENKNNTITILNRGNQKYDFPTNIYQITADVNDKDEIKNWMENKQFDSIINFVVWNKTDALSNIELFKDKTKQFIYISTVAALNHEYHCLINEKASKGNRYSEYGKNKAAAEDTFLEEYKKTGFPITIIRPTQTYSKDRIPLSIKGSNCWTVVQRMIEGKEVIVHGDGQSVWASTHAEDFARGIEPIVANDKSVGEVYQIMNPEAHTWDMVYQILAEELGVEYKPIYISTELLRKSKTYNFEQSIQGDKRWSNIFDISKLLEINPNFMCKISLREGLRRYLSYMGENTTLKTVDEDFNVWCDETIDLYNRSISVFDKSLK